MMRCISTQKLTFHQIKEEGKLLSQSQVFRSFQLILFFEDHLPISSHLLPRVFADFF